MTFLQRILARSSSFTEVLKGVNHDPSFLKDLIDDMDHEGGTDEEKNGLIYDRVSTLVRRMEKSAEYKGQRLIVYRCLNVALETFLASKKPVGAHWTYNKDNIRCWEQDASDSGNWIYLVGAIEITALDPEATIRQNVLFDHEQEITIKGKAKVLISEIFDFKTNKLIHKFEPPKEFKN